MFLSNKIKKSVLIFTLSLMVVDQGSIVCSNNFFGDFFNNKKDKEKKWISDQTKEALIRSGLMIATLAFEIYMVMKMTELPSFKVYKPGEIKENFSSVAGNDEAIESFKDIVEYLKNPAVYNAIGAKPTSGILLTGSPGTGKTLLARALAGEASCAFIYASGSEFNGKFVGSGVERLKKLFYQARTQKGWLRKRVPCIIFIDEIEVLAKRRGTGFDNYGDQAVNELLTQLDGFVKDTECPVIVIAATNFPEKIDPAVLRPGRIDRTIHIEAPDCSDRKDILALHLKKVIHDKNLDLTSLAQRTIGFTGAELAEIIHTAARIAVNRGGQSVTQQDLEEALDMRTIGIPSKRPLSDKERKIVAYHEAGHALINLLLIPDRAVNKITIQPRGSALGVTHFVWTEEISRLWSREDYLNNICVAFGGRAAEELIFNLISTGPSGDLAGATNIAAAMVKKFGMGTGLMVDTMDNKVLAQDVSNQANVILNEQYDRTKKLLQDNSAALHTLAEALLKHETLLAPEIKTLKLVKSNNKNNLF